MASRHTVITATSPRIALWIHRLRKMDPSPPPPLPPRPLWRLAVEAALLVDLTEPLLARLDRQRCGQYSTVQNIWL